MLLGAAVAAAVVAAQLISTGQSAGGISDIQQIDEKIQSAYADTRTFTSGEFGSPQTPLPQLTIPTCTRESFANTGPPESPSQLPAVTFRELVSKSSRTGDDERASERASESGTKRASVHQ
jgi:hypothetical protein